MDFAGKVVLITGGGSGIGAAIALSFAKGGANVCIVGRNETKLENTFKDIKNQTTKEILTIRADISKDEDTKTVIKTIIEKFGKLDVLINNAAVFKCGSILNGKLMDVFDDVIEINLRGTVALTSLAAPYLIVTKGNIVNISSVVSTAVSQLPDQMSYAISKAAMEQFSRCVALELAPSGVRVNCVKPGPVITDILASTGFDEKEKEKEWNRIKALTALNRLSTVEEVADVVYFLANDKCESITGSVYTIDNGRLLNPHKQAA